jgi:hypothetical protein
MEKLAEKGYKFCPRCDCDRPITDFYKNGKDKKGNIIYHHICKLHYRKTNKIEKAEQKILDEAAGLPKLCITCGPVAGPKPLSDFYFRKDLNHYKDECKACVQERGIRRYENNTEEILSKNKIRRDNKTEEEKKIESARKHQQYEENKDTILAKQKEAYDNLSEEEKCALLERHRSYRNNNRDKIRAARRERYHTDLFFKLRDITSKLVRAALKRQDSDKGGKTIGDFIPWTPKELMEHIKQQFQLPGNEWMTFDNHGKYDAKIWDDNDPSTWKWNLDHIIPQSDLPYSSMEDENFKKCWSLENLRPYSAKQNIIDGTRRIRHTKNSESKDIK